MIWGNKGKCHFLGAQGNRYPLPAWESLKHNINDYSLSHYKSLTLPQNRDENDRNPPKTEVCKAYVKLNPLIKYALMSFHMTVNAKCVGSRYIMQALCKRSLRDPPLYTHALLRDPAEVYRPSSVAALVHSK